MTMRYYSSTAGEMSLQTGVSPSDTTITVDTTSGLPVTFPYTLFLDYGSASEEIVDVTAAAGTTLTVVRGRDGSVAQSHTFGAKIRHGITARDHRESRDHEAAVAAHGATGAVVGTTNTQTLDKKTFQPAADNTALKLRARSGNTAPLMDVRDAADTSTGIWTDGELALSDGTNKVFQAYANGGPFFWKRVLSLRLFSDVHALTGDVQSGATGRFLRLLSGAAELFYVASNGDMKARAGTFASNVAVTGTLSATGAITSPTITSLTTADSSLSGRVGTLEGQTLDTRISAVETNLGAQTRFAATSTTKDAKRLHWGAAAVGTGDASGYRTITHGAGFTPTVVHGTLDGAFRVGVDNITATTFRIQIVQTDGSPYVAYTGNFYYTCGE